MKLIKKGKEVSLGGKTWRLPSTVISNDVKCDEDGHPCGNDLCCAVYDTPEKYPDYELVD